MTRTFRGGPSIDDVTRVAEVALRAPSAGFSQGVHLVVLSGGDADRFWDRSGARSWFENRSPGVLEAPHVVLVFGDSQAYMDRYSLDDKRDLGFGDASRWHTPYWLVDAGMVAQNMLLLAEERRWGALFFGVHGNQEEYFATLHIPQSAHCIGAIAIGYRSSSDRPSGSSTTRSRRAPDETVHIGTW
jgi:nitroreductase